MTNALPITIDHLWGGIDKQCWERAQRGDQRASDVVRALGEACAEIAAGEGRCTACDTALKTDREMHACTVVRILDEPGLALAMPFCIACATSQQRLSQLVRTHLAAALGVAEPAAPGDSASPQVRAHDLVLADAWRAGEELRRRGMRVDAHTFADIIAGKAAPVDNHTLVQLVIGTRDELSRAEAIAAAAAWKQLRQTAPRALIYVQLLGYDQDPREIWQFAEVRRHVRIWARAAGIPADSAVAERELPDPQFPTLLGVLAGSGWFGERIRQETLARYRAEYGAATAH